MSIKNFSEFSLIPEVDIKFLLDNKYIIAVYPMNIRNNELNKILEKEKKLGVEYIEKIIKKNNDSYYIQNCQKMLKQK